LRIQTDCRYELAKYELRDAKVIQQAGKWYIFLCIEKETEQPKLVTSVFAIDLGVWHIAVTTNTANKDSDRYVASISASEGSLGAKRHSTRSRHSNT
jgi:transposase